VYSRLISDPRITIQRLGGPSVHFMPADTPPPDLPRLPGSRRPALVALIVTVLLVLGGALLVRALSRTASLQDCVMSGRTNCAPIEPPAGNGA